MLTFAFYLHIIKLNLRWALMACSKFVTFVSILEEYKKSKIYCKNVGFTWLMIVISGNTIFTVGDDLDLNFKFWTQIRKE